MHRFFFIALLLWASAGIAQEVGAAARVNGVEIPVFRLERYFLDYLEDKGRNVQMMTNPAVYKRMKREALEQLIEAELLWQAAQKKNLIAPPQEVRSAMEQLRSQFSSEDAYRRKLDVAGFTEETYADYVKQALSARRYVAQEAGASPKETIERLRAGAKIEIARGL